jgi:hypothetical protein
VNGDEMKDELVRTSSEHYPCKMYVHVRIDVRKNYRMSGTLYVGEDHAFFLGKTADRPPTPEEQAIHIVFSEYESGHLSKSLWMATLFLWPHDQEKTPWVEIDGKAKRLQKLSTNFPPES